jgi:hypothetical protein
MWKIWDQLNTWQLKQIYNVMEGKNLNKWAWKGKKLSSMSTGNLQKLGIPKKQMKKN